MLLKIGDKIRVRSGASEIMKMINYWHNDLGQNIDGATGEIVGYAIDGDCEDWLIDIGLNDVVGIPKFLLELDNNKVISMPLFKRRKTKTRPRNGGGER